MVRVIDASTAHRVAPGWAYGFPELEPDGYDKIAAAKRVSNPGCWPTGFLAIVRPLVRAGLLPADFPVTVNGVSGYSGGGKSMIAEFEDKSAADYSETVSRIYGLNLQHKHIPEMQQHSGLAHAPLFQPSIGRFYRGMLVEVPLQLWALPGKPSARDIHAALVKAYPDRPLVKVASLEDAAAVKTLDAEILAGSNGLTLYVFANEKTAQARVVAVFDNLGKGASGCGGAEPQHHAGPAGDDGSLIRAKSFGMFRGWNGITLQYCCRARIVRGRGAVYAVHHQPEPAGFLGLEFTGLTPAASARTPHAGPWRRADQQCGGAKSCRQSGYPPGRSGRRHRWWWRSPRRGRPRISAAGQGRRAGDA